MPATGDNDELRAALLRITQLSERLELREADMLELYAKVTDWVNRSTAWHEQAKELQKEFELLFPDLKSMMTESRSLQAEIRQRLDGTDADWWKQGGNED